MTRLEYEPIPCIWCDDTGLCDYDAGLGNVRKRFCDCAKGKELEEKHGAAREEKEGR